MDYNNFFHQQNQYMHFDNQSGQNFNPNNLVQLNPGGYVQRDNNWNASSRDRGRHRPRNDNYRDRNFNNDRNNQGQHDNMYDRNSYNPQYNVDHDDYNVSTNYPGTQEDDQVNVSNKDSYRDDDKNNSHTDYHNRELNRSPHHNKDQDWSRERDCSREEDISKESHRTRERDQSRERDYSREGEGNRDQDRSRERDRSKGRDDSRESDLSSDQDRSRERDRNKGRDDSRERDPNRHHDRNRERNRTRERDHSKEKDCSKERDHSVEKDRSRERHCSRDSDYNRDKDRSREKDYDRDRDREYDHRDGRHLQYDDRSDDTGNIGFQREKFISSHPTNTIVIRGFSKNCTEKQINSLLKKCCPFPVKEIRLINRLIKRYFGEKGSCRGFAFVEFHSIDIAQNWMEQYQGEFYMDDGTRITMYYGTPRGSSMTATNTAYKKPGWICNKCKLYNFKGRDVCFVCSISKEESEHLPCDTSVSLVGSDSCDTLLFRSLDALTTEETLHEAITKVSNINCKNVMLVRDPVVNVSRCFGFAEFASNEESDYFLSIIVANPPFEVDGKRVLVSYASKTYSVIMSILDREYKKYNNYNEKSSRYSTYSHDRDSGQYGESGSSYSAKNRQEGTSQNAAAAVAQAAIQRRHNQKQQHDTSSDSTASTDNQQTPVVSPQNVPDGSGQYSYPIPDVSTYQYDSTSSFYYDPTTGLYYDGNTQYYYNSHIGKYLYWDGGRETYLLEPSQQQQQQLSPGNTSNEPIEKKGKEKKEKEKVKVAKQIAKDMAKWAKSQNAKKEAQADTRRAINTNIKESATADCGFNILEKRISSEERTLMPPPSTTSLPGTLSPSSGTVRGTDSTDTGLVASYGGDSDDDDNDSSDLLDEAKLIDWSKLACLLCKRQFPSKDTLTKHQQLSDLHKKNLEELRKTTEGNKSSIQYRDRAKERRQKYGAPEPPAPKRIKRPAPEIVVEQPTRDGLGQDNIGNKLLQKMGWSEGRGLGRSGQGRTDPIEAKRRRAAVGLGSAGADLDYDPSDTYKESAKKAMYARYNQYD